MLAAEGISLEKAQGDDEIFVVLLVSGFDNIPRSRSALMFATLAATADYRTVLYCIQNGVDIMVSDATEGNEVPKPGVPTLKQRLSEAVEEGIEILCCSQTLANKNLDEDDLLEGVKAAGATTLVDLTTRAKGVLCF